MAHSLRRKQSLGDLCSSHPYNHTQRINNTHTHMQTTYSIIVMDHDDFGTDEPLGAARIPLYEATGLDGTHLRKLLADLRSIRVCMCVYVLCVETLL